MTVLSASFSSRILETLTPCFLSQLSSHRWSPAPEGHVWLGRTSEIMALPHFPWCAALLLEHGGGTCSEGSVSDEMCCFHAAPGLTAVHFHQLLYPMSCSCVAHLYMYPQLLAGTLPLRFTKGMSCLEIS